MKKGSVLLLKKQIEKLHSENFDLEAWKSSTISSLARIFGSDDSKISQIMELKIDYGSWALRDAQGSYNPLETCKKKGEELLLATIDELNILGLPEKENTNKDLTLINILEDELKVSQLKSIKEILSSDKKDTDKQVAIKKSLETIGKNASSKILSQMILASRKEILS